MKTLHFFNPAKKIKLLFIATLFSASTMAQAPESFNYQTVVRDNTGVIIPNQNVSFRFSILQGGTAGVSVYTETHVVATNQFGLANVKIGQGVVESGSMAGINWGADSYFLQTEIDPAGGVAYTLMGATQLLSVPYALHAKTVEIDNVDDADADPANELQTLSTAGTSISISGGNSVDITTVVPKTTFTRFGGLNDTDRDIPAPFVVTAVSPAFTFTKASNETIIEATVNANAVIGSFTGGCTSARFALIVDGNTAAFYDGGQYNLRDAGVYEFASFESVFTGLSAGSHTIEIYGITYVGEALDIVWDAGGYGGSIMIKETW
ncbi:MAG TPA: hypothetical protein VD905_17055 [Flavobacteriales bacterium]|nr:hypothetical protein [Flavobacteriales bacterium]